MTMETKQLHALSKIYKEAVYGGAKKEAPKDTRLVVTAADKKAKTPAWKNFKAGHKGYKAADHLTTEDAKYGYDKDGKSLNPKDKKKVATGPRLGEPREKGAKYSNAGEGRKIQNRTRKWMDKQDPPMKGAPGLDAMKAREAEHRAKRGVKKEAFSDWRQDLKEIPDYEQIPASAKKRNEKISEKNVKNTVKINPEMKEELKIIEEYADELSEADIGDILARLEKKRISKGGDPDESPLGKKTGRAMKAQQDKARKKAGLKTEDVEIEEGVYEKQKTKEVMSALKRDKRPLDKKTKAKIASDIVKKKGDTSKSDDRYAYESKLWDEVAAHLTELGELNDVQFKVEGYQRDPEQSKKDRTHSKQPDPSKDGFTGIGNMSIKDIMKMNAKMKKAAKK